MIIWTFQTSKDLFSALWSVHWKSISDSSMDNEYHNADKQDFQTFKRKNLIQQFLWFEFHKLFLHCTYNLAFYLGCSERIFLDCDYVFVRDKQSLEKQFWDLDIMRYISFFGRHSIWHKYHSTFEFPCLNTWNCHSYIYGTISSPLIVRFSRFQLRFDELQLKSTLK